ncbi:Acetyl esterase/lipase [Sphingobium sp. AP50]|uniref:alpha/beta hydrolase n=1 Tax=Sphingobium sp. AP50 TaxID=1884369 RepID=UPI0008D829C1|nr:alpha/beta hydrolase [Sphingobium sp. AP50]SEJ95440.1 Acetyl esterase/lipase [Sphingobium sp. AP50]
MTTAMTNLVEADYREIVQQIPMLQLSGDGLLSARSAMVDMFLDLLPLADDPAIPPRTIDEAPVILFEPAVSSETARAAILYIHSGGFVMGNAAMMNGYCARLANEFGVVIANVDYRLAPEAPFPGPLEDCYSGLCWLFEQAAMLNVDPGRIAVMGDSGGGGLAAALCLLARDRGGPQPSAQLLMYPMLDCRTGSPQEPCPNPFTGAFLWTRAMNQFGWGAMRGHQEVEAEQLGHFSPSLARDFSALPPAFIGVGTLDLFVDECLAYAQHLLRAGVSVELRTYPGCFHGFDRLPGDPSVRFERDLFDAIRRMLALDPSSGTSPGRTA